MRNNLQHETQHETQHDDATCVCCERADVSTRKMLSELNALNEKFNSLSHLITEMKILLTPKVEKKQATHETYAECIKMGKMGNYDAIRALVNSYEGLIEWSSHLLLRVIISSGDINTVKFFLENFYAGDASAANAKQLSLISSAGNNVPMIMYLIEYGADICADDNRAIKNAAYNGWLEVVKLLHARGADIRAEDNYAVRYAAWCRNIDVMEYLASCGADVRADRDAIVSGVICGLDNDIYADKSEQIIRIYKQYGGDAVNCVLSSGIATAIKANRTWLADIFHKYGGVMSINADVAKFSTPYRELPVNDKVPALVVAPENITE